MNEPVLKAIKRIGTGKSLVWKYPAHFNELCYIHIESNDISIIWHDGKIIALFSEPGIVNLGNKNIPSGGTILFVSKIY